jgi:hypothetical protein
MGRPSSKLTSQARNVQLTDELLNKVITGISVQQAAKELEIPYSTALRWYHEALQKIYDDNAGLRREVLGRELKTLDLLQRALWPSAQRGHVRSVEVMLAVMDRRAKYLGLDAAAKVEVEVTRVDEALTQIARVIDGEVESVAAPLLRAQPQ